MKRKRNFLLAKFGKKEHLESLIAGNLRLTAIDVYRKIENNFMGDDWEGYIPVDPSTISLKNSKGEVIHLPSPLSVKFSFVDYGQIPVFCASILNSNVMDKVSENSFMLKESFKCEMEKFLDGLDEKDKYILLFNSDELINNLKNSIYFKNKTIAYISQPVVYKDFKNYSSFFKNLNPYNPTPDAYDLCFIKRNIYCWQNEWRLIVDGTEKVLDLNSNNTVTLQIPPLENFSLYHISEFFS